MEQKNIYIRHDPDMDRRSVMELISEQIVDGKIRCTGMEQRDGEVYWVRDCGEYELVLPMPYDEAETMVFDVSGRRALQFDVRRKKQGGN